MRAIIYSAVILIVGTTSALSAPVTTEFRQGRISATGIQDLSISGALTAFDVTFESQTVGSLSDNDIPFSSSALALAAANAVRDALNASSATAIAFGNSFALGSFVLVDRAPPSGGSVLLEWLFVDYDSSAGSWRSSPAPFSVSLPLDRTVRLINFEPATTGAVALPAPATLPLMAAGLGLVGFLSRRRKS